jgi:hypothetical protein
MEQEYLQRVRGLRLVDITSNGAIPSRTMAELGDLLDMATTFQTSKPLFNLLDKLDYARSAPQCPHFVNVCLQKGLFVDLWVKLVERSKTHILEDILNHPKYSCILSHNLMHVQNAYKIAVQKGYVDAAVFVAKRLKEKDPKTSMLEMCCLEAARWAQFSLIETLLQIWGTSLDVIEFTDPSFLTIQTSAETENMEALRKWITELRDPMNPRYRQAIVTVMTTSLQYLNWGMLRVALEEGVAAWDEGLHGIDIVMQMESIDALEIMLPYYEKSWKQQIYCFSDTMYPQLLDRVARKDWNTIAFILKNRKAN